jgi:glycosyltransferase involved in cell wall biosynthesis
MNERQAVRPTAHEQPARILVVCPKYFPTEEGLAHYTTEFCRHLAERCTVAVLTSDVSAGVDHGAQGVEVLADVRRWGFGGPFFALKSALRFDPDRVLIQFVPFMYSERGGINLTLVAFAWFWKLRALRHRKGAVHVMFHEIWFPLSRRPSAVVMHVLHRCMALGVSLAAEHNFCATGIAARLVEKQLRPFARPVDVLFVGSNLERSSRPVAVRSPERTPLKVCIFGSVHPSKNVPLVLRTLQAAQHRASRPFEVTVIGLSLEQAIREAPELRSWLETKVRVTGHLSAEAAADELGAQDLAICYFSDGVSGRRGSMLAALCEGTPIVTTAREYTDASFFGQPSLKLLSCDERRFESELTELLCGEERPFAGVSRDEVRRYYEENFSWRAIVDRYIALSRLPAKARAT